LLIGIPSSPHAATGGDRMKRRSLLATFGATTVVPWRAEAQPAIQPIRIGVLSPFTPADAAPWHRAFEAGLQQLGWIGGRNIRIEYRFANGASERLPDLAADILRLKVDLVVTEVTEASHAVQKATSSVPVVMISVGDPVAAGLVASLARPGGNITGLSQNVVESAGKRLDLLKLVIPPSADIAVLWNPEDDNSAFIWRELQVSATHLGARLKSLEAATFDALDKLLRSGFEPTVRALFVVPSPLFVTSLDKIAAAALERKVASIFHLTEFVHVGGLLAYGPDRADMFRRAAFYVDKILKGAKPADLPVEQPNKFELAVNLKTARAIGMTIPPLVLAQADEVVE
jgi:putative ABC transport system substrate-binding protein